MGEIRKDLEALQLAIQTEKEGYEMFRKAAESSKNDFMKDLFMRLAKDELMHMDLIKRFYAELQEKKSWRELTEEDLNVAASKREMRTIFSDAVKLAREGKLEIDQDDVEVYRRAAQFEKDGTDLYDKLYHETDDKKARKFYAFLREMEREHMEVLDNTLQYLDNPQNWHLLTEGWTMED